MKSNTAYPFLSQLEIDQDVSYRLSIQLDRIKFGNNENFVTPLGADNNSKIILDEIDLLFSDNLKDINDVLKDLEVSNRDKFGSRSIALPWSELKDNFYESFESDHILGNLDVKIAPSSNSLRPIDRTTALKLLKNSTNSGLPYYTRKSKVKERVLKDFEILNIEKYPCIMFTRTQEANKTRPVWGYPISDTLNEMCFYSPLLSFQKNQNYRAALIGPEEVSRKLVELVLKAQSNSRTLVSVDFSHYDRDVKERLQYFAFFYIKELFQVQYSSEIDEIALRFLTIGIITPDGIIYGPHGVPSGSTFTNEVDSIVQMLISIQLSFVSLDDMQVQGDDGVYLIPNDCKDKLITQFEEFGLTVNREKSYTSSEYAVFLQCLYHIYYINKGIFGGIYPIYRALNRLCFQERWSNFEDFDIVGKDFYSIRAICIMENCKYHPLFESFVKIVIKHDKYSLDFSSQGLSRYVHMIESTEGAEGILFNQFGDNIKGFKSFETYKLIKRLG